MGNWLAIVGARLEADRRDLQAASTESAVDAVAGP